MVEICSSKFQKDRKAMPSVRVDLIFQACNIDYTLDAKDRAEADDGEMESTEWTESLSYRLGDIQRKLPEV